MVKARLILGDGDIIERYLREDYDGIEWARRMHAHSVAPPLIRVVLDKDKDLTRSAGVNVYVERSAR